MAVGRLKISRAEYYQLTPAQFLRCLKEHDGEQRIRHIWAATSIAALYNVHRDPHAHPEPYSARDLFPGLFEDTDSYHKETVDETVARLRAYVQTLPPEYRRRPANGG